MSFDPNILAEALWRMYPHTFMERITAGRWRSARHMAFIGEKIAEAIAHKKTGIIINAPPRHRKSWLTSWAVPTWYLEHFPHHRVVLASYSAALAIEYGDKTRNEFETNAMLTTRVRKDKRAVEEWQTHAGGGMISVGVGGSVLGKGGNLVIVDDPHKNWEEAYSKTYRERAWSWFSSTLWSRREPGALIVIAMQRFHPDDVCGRIMAQPEIAEHFDIIRLPAIAGPHDAIGRAEGEPLDPQRYGVSELATIRTMNQFGWDAMYQQNPTGEKKDRVYASFVEADNQDPRMRLVPELPLDLSIDFNVNPGMHMEVGQYNPRADVFTVRHEIHGPRMKTAEAMDAFERLIKSLGGWRWPTLQVYGDASGESEHTSTSETDYDVVKRKLRMMGVPFRVCVPNRNPPVKARIESMNDALLGADGKVHYLVHPECVRLIADFKTLQRGEDGLIDKSDADLSHASDAEGYRVFWRRPIRSGNVASAGRVLV